MELCERIALARKGAGLSQEQLGEKLGVSRQAVSKWESGQTNPDVAYVAEMCRLFGVSSDWLLLGEEHAQEASPARCPGCQAIVTGLDNYCPNCGQNLKGNTADTYTLLLRPAKGVFTLGDDLIVLSKTGWFPEDSPLAAPLSQEEATRLVHSAPVVLARGLNKKTAAGILDKVSNLYYFNIYRDRDGNRPEDFADREPIHSSQFHPPKEPLSFGMMVFAVILGVVGAIFLLSFL